MKRNLKSLNSVDGTTLKKIKTLSFQQQKEDEEDTYNDNIKIIRNSIVTKKDDSDSDIDSEEESVHSMSENEEELNEEEKDVLEKYNNSSIAQDIISGMKEAQSEVASHMDMDDMELLDIDEIEGCKEDFVEIITVLSKLKSGRSLPKLVKVLPQTSDWNYVIDRLEFPSWTPAAVKLMADQFRAKGGSDAEFFYKAYLLPYIRSNINENKRLDNALFQTLKDAMYRRKEFMKGILIPWCKYEDEDAFSNKEAEVLSNVINHVTVKADVGTTAMHIIITKMEYSKARMLVLRSFIEKKYTLPILLISELVHYFYRATIDDYAMHYNSQGQMALCWFQTLNVFVSLNYMYLTDEDLKKLLKVCRVQKHEKVTPSIVAYLKLRSNNNMMETAQ